MNKIQTSNVTYSLMGVFKEGKTTTKLQPSEDE